jgi:para-aminobenzoate synthetase
MSFELLADLLAAEVARRVAASGRAVVALDGFGCCGKSTLAQALAARTDAVSLETDDFHQPADGVIEPDSPLRYRRWRALHAAALGLARGQSVRYAPIDWDTHRLADEVIVHARPVLIIDGIGSHVLALPAAPLRIFVDGRAESRMARVAARDGSQFANWDHYVAIEHGYFARHQPWRTADLVVLGAELDFGNSHEGFARRIESGAGAQGERLDRPFVDQAGKTPVDR